MGKYAGKSKLALRPKNTEQVSKVLAYCNERRLAIVPQVRAFPRSSQHLYLSMPVACCAPVAPSARNV